MVCDDRRVDRIVVSAKCFFLWQSRLGTPPVKERMMHLILSPLIEKRKNPAWGNDLTGGERRKRMWGDPQWVSSQRWMDAPSDLDGYSDVGPDPAIYLQTLVSCQGLLWLDLEGHIQANEVQSVPGSFVFLQLK